MTRKDLSEISAQYAVAHRCAFETIGKMVDLAKLDTASKHSPEVLEVLEAYQNTRIKLIEALHWKTALHQTLMVRTDEGRKAMREYTAAMEKAQKDGDSAKAAVEPVVEPPAVTSAETAEQPSNLVLLPRRAEGRDEGPDNG